MKIAYRIVFPILVMIILFNACKDSNDCKQFSLTATVSGNTVTFMQSGGNPPYSDEYLWENGTVTSGHIYTLSPGTYNVAVYDSEGCIASTSFTVN